LQKRKKELTDLIDKK
jgi:hypothetical protein